MKILDLTNSEIKAQGGVFLRTETEFSNHYSGYIETKVFLLNGEEVISNGDWVFQSI